MSNVKVILTGDQTEGLNYAAHAISVAKSLRAQGHTSLERTVVIGTATLRVVLGEPHDKVYIDAQAVCPTLNYAGFVDTYPSDSSYPTGKSKRIEELQNIAEKRVDRMQRVGNTDPAKIVMMPESGPPEGWEQLPADPTMYGIRSATPNDAGEYPLEAVAPPAGEQAWRSFFEDHNPARYSGIMRRALQATFATDTWAEALTHTVGGRQEFILNYTAGDSWGIIVNPAHDGSHGRHYRMVNVRSDGIYAVSADFCVHDIAGVFVPVIRAVYPDTAQLVAEFDGATGSSSDEIGWAFSYTGAQCAQVCFSREFADQGYNSVTDAAITRLVVVNMQFSAEGDIVGASVMYEPWKTFWHHAYSENVVTVAEVAGLLNTVVKFSGKQINKTFNVRPYGTRSRIREYRTEDTALFCTYSEDGNLNVCRYWYHFTPSSTVSYTTSPRTVYTPFIVEGYPSTFGRNPASDITPQLTNGLAGTKTLGEVYDYGFSYRAESTAKHTASAFASGTEYRLIAELGEIIPGQASTLFEGEYYDISYMATWILPPSTPWTYAWAMPGGTLSGDYVRASLDLAIVGTRSIGCNVGGVSTRASVTLCVGDREALVMFQDKMQYPAEYTGGSYTYSLAYTGDCTAPKNRFYGTFTMNPTTASVSNPTSPSADCNVARAHTARPFATTSYSFNSAYLPISPWVPGVTTDNVFYGQACDKFYILAASINSYSSVTPGQYGTAPNPVYTVYTRTSAAMTNPHPPIAPRTEPNELRHTRTAKLVLPDQTISLAFARDDAWDFLYEFKDELHPANYKCVQSAYNKLVAYDKSRGTTVVRLGTKEYNVSNALSGWLGAV